MQFELQFALLDSTQLIANYRREMDFTSGDNPSIRSLSNVEEVAHKIGTENELLAKEVRILCKQIETLQSEVELSKENNANVEKEIEHLKSSNGINCSLYALYN